MDLISKGFFEKGKDVGVDVFGGGFQALVEFGIDIGNWLAGGKESELLGLLAVHVFDIVAAAPAPRSPWDAEVFVDANPKIEV